MLKHTNDTAAGGLIRGMLRACGEFCLAEGHHEAAETLYALADRQMPTPDPGYKLMRLVNDNGYEVWAVASVRTKNPRTAYRPNWQEFISGPLTSES